MRHGEAVGAAEPGVEHQLHRLMRGRADRHDLVVVAVDDQGRHVEASPRTP
jgi:hypothetical protein